MIQIVQWKYKNTALLFLSIVLLFLLVDTHIAHALIAYIGTYGYVGAIVSGAFFVSTFTAVPAAVVLFHLAQQLDPILIALCAGLGASIGDMLMFRFLKNSVFEELRPLFDTVKGAYIGTLFRTPYFSWIIPVVGALIVMSPFPDEVGIALMGLSNLKSWQFILLTFTLNALGIFFIVSLAVMLQ